MYSIREKSIIRGSNSTYRVGALLGSGSQGDVYRAESNGKSYAIKWYNANHQTKNQRKNIEQIINFGSPGRNFLWPIEMVTHGSSFGYVMELRKNGYYPLTHLMKGKIDISFKHLVRAAETLVKAFDRLHRKKLCYRDISFGNVFICPHNGDVLICDNDNVGPEHEGVLSVLGTPRFMAPEIVVGKSAPDISSDRFSLAILLFYMLFVHHPFEGRQELKIKCFDLPAMKRLYGEKPVFIFDPRDTSNRPSRQLQKNALIYWGIYPDFLKKAFVEVFTLGINDKSYRKTEKDWIEILYKLNRSIVKCNCSAENFMEATKRDKTCWNCGARLLSEPVLSVHNNRIMIKNGVMIYDSELLGRSAVSGNNVVAMVNSHPKNNSILGIKNISNDDWTAIKPDGSKKIVKTGSTIKVEIGTKIRMGNIDAHITY